MKKYNTKEKILFIISIMIISGIFGYIYVILFYRIDLGYFAKRGKCFGPWLPLYAFGGLLITLFTYKHQKKPIKVFLIAMITCGILEYITGYLLLNISNERLWDYNTEIWNFGNIQGFICLRSVLFFGISGMLLVYVIIPLISSFIKQNKYQTAITIIGIMFSADFIINYIMLKL